MKRTLIAMAVMALILSLEACGYHVPNDITTQEHIRVATMLCEPNGGLKQIGSAQWNDEYEGCGYKCVRKTGRIEYSMGATCNNDAFFSKRWTK